MLTSGSPGGMPPVAPGGVFGSRVGAASGRSGAARAHTHGADTSGAGRGASGSTDKEMWAHSHGSGHRNAYASQSHSHRDGSANGSSRSLRPTSGPATRAASRGGYASGRAAGASDATVASRLTSRPASAGRDASSNGHGLGRSRTRGGGTEGSGRAGSSSPSGGRDAPAGGRGGTSGAIGGGGGGAGRSGSGGGGGGSGSGTGGATSSTSAGAGSSGGGDDGSSGGADGNIIIHVCDENRKVNKDFVCKRSLLLAEMRYFRNYLTGNSYDVDISVHCDVHIFEWLMKFINAGDKAAPSLEVKSVVSILISSNFLEMAGLVEQCLQFVHDHFNQIVKLPIDLNCLSPPLLSRLARLFFDDELDTLRDRKDKLLSKVYMKRLEQMFEDEDNVLFCCDKCQCLYTSSQRESMECNNAKVFVDFHGNAIARHIPNRGWSLNKFIQSLREQGMAWSTIYWRLWGIVHSMKCTTCELQFMCAAHGHCLYHPEEPNFTSSDNTGVYPCCDAPAYRFDASMARSGCRVRNHTVDRSGPDGPIMALLQKHEDLVAVPYAGADEHGVIARAPPRDAAAATGPPHVGASSGDSVAGAGGGDPRDARTAGAAAAAATFAAGAEAHVAPSPSPMASLARLGATADGDDSDLGFSDAGVTPRGGSTPGGGSDRGGGDRGLDRGGDRSSGAGGVGSRPARLPPRDERLVGYDGNDGEESVHGPDEGSGRLGRPGIPLSSLARRRGVAGGRRRTGSDPARMSPRRSRMMRMDAQRSEDEAHMETLMASLQGLRSEHDDGSGRGGRRDDDFAPRTPFGR